jgi:uncharacterized OsmC-like protein
MGTIKVSARWTGEGLNYVGTDSKGHQIPMGRDDISPSQMLLLGAAGCMGMEVQVTGHQPDEYPKPFHTIEIVFTIKGEVDPQAVTRAIELSRDKYCVVGQTLQQKAELKTSFTVEEG